MPVVDAYAERKANKALRETWGHLDAEVGVHYLGTITFAEGAFGRQRIILTSDFGDAGYGPWFYEAIHDWLCEQETEPGKLYHFQGWYRLRNDGQHQFVGKIHSTAIDSRRQHE